MMMRAGVSYADWRLMAPFQRRDWLARRTVEMAALKKKLEETKELGDFIGMLATKLMGF